MGAQTQKINLKPIQNDPRKTEKKSLEDEDSKRGFKTRTPKKRWMVPSDSNEISCFTLGTTRFIQGGEGGRKPAETSGWLSILDLPSLLDPTRTLSVSLGPPTFVSRKGPREVERPTWRIGRILRT